jgi:hypothetical protein
MKKKNNKIPKFTYTELKYIWGEPVYNVVKNKIVSVKN